MNDFVDLLVNKNLSIVPSSPSFLGLRWPTRLVVNYKKYTDKSDVMITFGTDGYMLKYNSLLFHRIGDLFWQLNEKSLLYHNQIKSRATDEKFDRVLDLITTDRVRHQELDVTPVKLADLWPILILGLSSSFIALVIELLIRKYLKIAHLVNLKYLSVGVHTRVRI